MEKSKDFNFFYINDKELPLKVLITSSLGEGKYTQEDIQEQIERIKEKNNGRIMIYQDDGENFWEIFSGKKLDIGSKENNYKKWDEIKIKAYTIDVEDLIVFCSFKEVNMQQKRKLK